MSTQYFALLLIVFWESGDCVMYEQGFNIVGLLTRGNVNVASSVQGAGQ